MAFSVFLFSFPGLAKNSDSHPIKVSLKFHKSQLLGGEKSIVASLKIKNNSSETFYELKASVLSTQNMVITVSQRSLGTLKPQTTAESEQFVISVPYSGTQERSITKMSWKIEYKNALGDLITEEIIL
jgi:hypothetical protein